MATAKVDKSQLPVYRGDHHVVGFQVEKEHLVMMKIRKDGKKLVNQPVGMRTRMEITGIGGKKVGQRVTVDIFLQDVGASVFVAQGYIAWQSRMVEAIAYLELFSEGLDILRHAFIFCLELFLEMQLPIDAHNISLAGRAVEIQLLLRRHTVQWTGESGNIISGHNSSLCWQSMVVSPPIFAAV